MRRLTDDELAWLEDEDDLKEGDIESLVAEVRAWRAEPSEEEIKRARDAFWDGCVVLNGTVLDPMAGALNTARRIRIEMMEKGE